MAKNKTQATVISVADFLAEKVADEQARKDSLTLISLMEKVTGKPATMWGPSIIGFDKYHYKYESGREGEICVVGFSPRKGNISLYVKLGIEGQEALLPKLGKYTAAKGCLYVKKLADVDLTLLENIVKNTVDYTKKLYPD
jgi:hypothetical protein